jgi:lysophospholipase L1-like esterase
MRRVLLPVLALFALASGATASQVGAAAAAPVPPPAQPGYYLSLGDSLAFGYQPDLVAAGDLNPADYRSYAEDFAAMRPALTLVNYGCPGETTITMSGGGCAWPSFALHDSYGAAASQLDAAVAFLGSHLGQVKLISVDIGSNDLLAVLGQCGSTDISCIQAGIQQMAGRYAQIVGTLRALAPDAKIVLFNFYNPLALSFPGSDTLAQGASTVVDQVAAAFGASVADAFGAINHVAGSPSEKAFLCARTWECTSYQNIHPTDLGYRALAIALLHAVNG